MTDWFEDGSASKAVDVHVVMDSAAPDALWHIVSAGALVSIGRTSDGGALGVTVTMDGRWRREYFRESEELVDWLTGALAAVEAEAARADASPSRRKRERGSRAR